ncbi:MAG: nucleotidyltransferase domain-containing protein [Candidatus Woesearchaeota archaeon]
MSNITQNKVTCLKPFTNSYNLKLTQSKLSKITKIPQQTLSRYLNSFVKEGIIDYTIEGRNKLFYIKKDVPITYPTFQLLEIHKEIDFLQNQITISVIINQLLDYCETIILFGSYAKNVQTKNSDLDLIIVGKSNKEKIKEIKRKFHLEINEQYITIEELKKSFKEKNYLTIEILNNHILFGEISKIIKLFMEI